MLKGLLSFLFVSKLKNYTVFLCVINNLIKTELAQKLFHHDNLIWFLLTFTAISFGILQYDFQNSGKVIGLFIRLYDTLFQIWNLRLNLLTRTRWILWLLRWSKCLSGSSTHLKLSLDASINFFVNLSESRVTVHGFRIWVSWWHLSLLHSSHKLVFSRWRVHCGLGMVLYELAIHIQNWLIALSTRLSS